MRIDFAVRSLTLIIAIAVGCTAPSPLSGDAHQESLTAWHNFGDLRGLVRASDLVIEARVLERVSDRDVRGYAGQRVPVAFTEALVEVRSALKGTASGQLRIVQLGREGDPAQTYPEFPILRPGSDVILFLTDVSAEPIHADGSTKYGILAPVGLLEVQSGRLTTKARGHTAAEQAASLSLDQFRQRVREIAGN